MRPLLNGMRATRTKKLEGSLAETREQAAHCRACPLWKNATQTVFGAGTQRARVVLIGEQPGDQEREGSSRG